MSEPPDSPLMRGYISLKPALRTYVLKRVPSAADADDILHDLVTKLLSTASSDKIHNIHAYLFSAVNNLIRDWHRQALSRRSRAHVPIYDLEIADGDASPAQTLEARDTLKRLDRGLATLPEDARTAFVLHRVMGRTLSQVSEEMNISVARVRKLVDRSLARLAAQVWDDRS